MNRKEIENMSGIKARDIDPDLSGREFLALTRQGPVFYRVTVEQFVVDNMALRRRAGLEQMVGNSAIADALGPDEDIAKRIECVRKFVGMNDAMNLPVMALIGE